MISTLMSKETDNLAQYLAGLNELIEQHLEKLVPSSQAPYASLLEAARYSLLSGGKRIRPILAIATAEALGCPHQEALQPSCALEMIHTYSLIHDDLPSMDDDDFRRGKPSLHKAFSEAHATLAGDFLLTSAFEVLATDSALSAEQKVELIKSLAQGAGGQGMIAGQILDIEAEGKEVSLAHLKQIHRYKTGALISTSVEFGAILGKAPQSQRKDLRLFSDAIGLAFQIADDILDVTTNLKNKDSLISSDLKNHKSTYVSLIGLDESQRHAEELMEVALGALQQLPFSTRRLKEIAMFIVQRRT